MWEEAKQYVAKFGGDYFVDSGPLIVFDGRPIVTIKRRTTDGLMGVDLDVFTPEGHHAARVLGGKLKHTNRKAVVPNPYKIEASSGIYRVIQRNTNLIVCEVQRCDISEFRESLKPKPWFIEVLEGRTDGSSQILKELTDISNRVGTAIKVSTNLLLPNGAIFQASPDNSEVEGWISTENLSYKNVAGIGLYSTNAGSGISPKMVKPPEAIYLMRKLDRRIRLAANAIRPAKESTDKCQVAGDYSSSGCQHPEIRHVANGDTFPACEKCGTKVVWTIEVQSA
jgi:hypothetical protein